jgi:hypothetical protein
MSNKYHRYRNKIYALPPHSFLTFEFEYEGLPHAAHLPRGDTPKGNLDGAPPLLGRLQKLGQIHPDVKAPRGSGEQSSVVAIVVINNHSCRTHLGGPRRRRPRWFLKFIGQLLSKFLLEFLGQWFSKFLLVVVFGLDGFEAKSSDLALAFAFLLFALLVLHTVRGRGPGRPMQDLDDESLPPGHRPVDTPTGIMPPVRRPLRHYPHNVPCFRTKRLRHRGGREPPRRIRLPPPGGNRPTIPNTPQPPRPGFTGSHRGSPVHTFTAFTGVHKGSQGSRDSQSPFTGSPVHR